MILCWSLLRRRGGLSDGHGDGERVKVRVGDEGVLNDRVVQRGVLVVVVVCVCVLLCVPPESWSRR